MKSNLYLLFESTCSCSNIRIGLISLDLLPERRKNLPMLYCSVSLIPFAKHYCIIETSDVVVAVKINCAFIGSTRPGEIIQMVPCMPPDMFARTPAATIDNTMQGCCGRRRNQGEQERAKMHGLRGAVKKQSRERRLVENNWRNKNEWF